MRRFEVVRSTMFLRQCWGLFFFLFWILWNGNLYWYICIYIYILSALRLGKLLWGKIPGGKEQLEGNRRRPKEQDALAVAGRDTEVRLQWRFGTTVQAVGAKAKRLVLISQMTGFSGPVVGQWHSQSWVFRRGEEGLTGRSGTGIGVMDWSRLYCCVPGAMLRGSCVHALQRLLNLL